MRTGLVWAVFLLGMGVLTAGAQQGPAQPQQPSTAASMEGMDMGPSAEKAASGEKGKMEGMAMCHCKCMEHSMAMEGEKKLPAETGHEANTGPTTKMDPAMKMDGMAMGPMGGMAQMAGMKMEGTKKPVLPSGPLQIVFGEKRATWTTEALAALPHQTVTVYNFHAKANQTYSGVPLFSLLTRLGVPESQHGKDLRLYVVVEGADGYEAVYALAEMNPELHDTAVMLADSMDGKGLADNGPLQLIATGEKRPARWVRNLARIRILAAE